jgi:hypothetical protein
MLDLDWISERLPDNYEPPKPLTAAKIARLGNALDEVETLPRWRIEKTDAARDYILALRDKVWFELRKAQGIKHAPSQSDGLRLKEEYFKAAIRYDELAASVTANKRWLLCESRAVLGIADSNVTARELCDAYAARVLTESKFKIAQRKFHEARKAYKPRPDFVIIRGMQVPVGRTRKKVSHEQA